MQGWFVSADWYRQQVSWSSAFRIIQNDCYSSLRSVKKALCRHLIHVVSIILLHIFQALLSVP